MLVAPIEYTNIYSTTSQEGDTGSINIVQTIITIIATVIALFLANYLLDWKRLRQTRPILKINPDENPSTYENNVPRAVYNIETPLLLPELAKMTEFDLIYKINRIKVRNDGTTAAEDCKGIIIQNDIEMKICWNVPSERHKMTINAKSYEYLDICAVLIGDRRKIIDAFMDYVSKLIKSYRESEVTFDQRQELNRIEKDFYKRFPKAEDAENEFVPYIIAPTENDWQQPAFNNRKLKSGRASVRITSKNATPIEYKITILEMPQDGKIIKVNDAVKIKKK